jgi:tRNA(adenine34) deaminase
MPKQVEDIGFIRRTIELAQTAERTGSGAPIGAVIAFERKVVGEAYNRVEATCDPTEHAEIAAIRQASAKLKRSRFESATLYSSLQPCGMCTMAAIWAGISRIVYGAERNQVHEMYFEDRHLDITDFVRDAFKDDLTLTGGVLAQECAKLYYGPTDRPPEQEQANK